MGSNVLPYQHSNKTVDKPWGKEEWLEINESYCFKKIFVEDGKKLSVQYHKVKKETMCLMSGEAAIYINGKCFVMTPGDWIHINPGDVHMLHGIKNACILECSSPEVEDVVRLKDHYGRK